uniref:protein O-GlcNAc transferase n=1 Tax=viral metagenome TaxID=1070528 RepID=A0A6C0DZ90_9ZZZZ
MTQPEVNQSPEMQLAPIPEVVDSNQLFLEQYKHLSEIYNVAQNYFLTTTKLDNIKYVDCIKRSGAMIRYLDKLNAMQLQKIKEEVINTYYISCELLVRTVGLQMKRNGFNEAEKNTLYIGIAHSRKVLSLSPFHKKAMEVFKLVFLYLTIYNPNVQENIDLLSQVLVVDPCDYQLHYNLAFTFQRANKMESSIYHYKMAMGIIDLLLKSSDNQNVDAQNGLIQFKIKCLNGLGSLYYILQDRETSMYFFEIALQLDPNDPDVNNQVGVIYTELRYTDKAIHYYQNGIKNYQRAHISIDKEMLIASMHMNMGLAKCYECDFTGAIECYNQALKYKPRLSLAYQNKLLDVNYISHLIEDPMYISRLHKNINKIYPKVIENYKESCKDYVVKKDFLNFKNKTTLIKKGSKLKIAFVSGDFICHPVSFFIHTVLNNINYDIFDVYCYSVKVVNLESMFKKCKWHVVKNLSNVEFKDLIQTHKIDILFDLSAHTGDNRLDTFVLKPAPIQISYCGYPNSAGIKSMDYRITDKFADCEESQKYYQEKLVFMDHCFLSYTPSTGLHNLVALKKQPCAENNYITFGSFNRYNKINSKLISVWEKVLIAVPNARFVIKNKEFLTPKIKKQFFDTFTNKDAADRVIVLGYSDTYEEHLDDYNKMDISLDTFPYSGTTTSCESLMMGVPIITLFDNIRHYHSQNVTTSLLKNSNLDEYVAYTEDEYVQKAVHFSKMISELKTLKKDVREKFVKGHVCNHKEFVIEFENKLINLYKNHNW